MTPLQNDVTQRIIRRLLTNPGDYVWHTDYGAGLGSYVGEPYSPSLIEGTILNQLQLEPLVAETPAPNILFNQSMAEPFSTNSVTVQYQTTETSTAGTVLLTLGS